jgi:2-hydroxychromene-2-carboxylate isomerase
MDASRSAKQGKAMSKRSMPFDPLSSSAPLIIYMDFKSPYAYLAKDLAWALGDKLGIEIDWRPFTHDIPSYLGSAKLDAEGCVVESQRSDTQWKAVKAAYADVRRYGTLRNLVVRGTTRIWDSSLAGIGLLLAKQQGSAVLRKYMSITYERFWKRELNIEDPSVIDAVLGEAGARTGEFQKYALGEGRGLHDQIQRAAFDAGVFGVPTYIVEKEIFFGREHLPRIEWILSGRGGAPPGVAYEGGERASSAGTTRSALTIAIDFASPRSYLALKPTTALADQLGIEVDWRPFLVNPLKERKTAVRSDRGKRHLAIRAAYMERDSIRYLADRGIRIHDFGKQANSMIAALGLLWLKRGSSALVGDYVEQVFERYWRGQLDIENESAIRALLIALNAPTTGFETFASGDGRIELNRLRSELLEAGIFDVPAYLVNGETFVGREHLPLIRNRLASA